MGINESLGEWNRSKHAELTARIEILRSSLAAIQSIAELSGSKDIRASYEAFRSKVDKLDSELKSVGSALDKFDAKYGKGK